MAGVAFLSSFNRLVTPRRLIIEVCMASVQLVWCAQGLDLPEKPRIKKGSEANTGGAKFATAHDHGHCPLSSGSSLRVRRGRAFLNEFSLLLPLFGLSPSLSTWLNDRNRRRRPRQQWQQLRGAMSSAERVCGYDKKTNTSSSHWSSVRPSRSCHMSIWPMMAKNEGGERRFETVNSTRYEMMTNCIHDVSSVLTSIHMGYDDGRLAPLVRPMEEEEQEEREMKPVADNNGKFTHHDRPTEHCHRPLLVASLTSKTLLFPLTLS